MFYVLNIEPNKKYCFKILKCFFVFEIKYYFFNNRFKRFSQLHATTSLNNSTNFTMYNVVFIELYRNWLDICRFK